LLQLGFSLQFFVQLSILNLKVFPELNNLLSMFTLRLSKVVIAALFYFEFLNLQIFYVKLLGGLLELQIAHLLREVIPFLPPLRHVAHQLLQLRVLNDHVIVCELRSCICSSYWDRLFSFLSGGRLLLSFFFGAFRAWAAPGDAGAESAELVVVLDALGGEYIEFLLWLFAVGAVHTAELGLRHTSLYILYL
jgi:hypothetical protein